MSLKKTAIAMALAGTCSFANANEGFYVGVGLGAVGANTKESDSTGYGTLGQTASVGVIDAGYSAQVNKTWGVSVGATLDMNKTKLGTASAVNGYDLAFRGKDHYSVYVQPFLNLTPGAAVFGKLGYHSTKLDLASTTAGESFSHRLNGIGYGFGVKTMLTKNAYLQAEAMWVDYRSKTVSPYDYKTQTTAGILTLGYQFDDAQPASPTSGTLGSGFYAGLGLGAVGANFSSSSIKSNWADGQNNTVGMVDVGYAAQINPNWGVGLGATIDMNETKSGEGEPGNSRVRIKDHYAVYVQPFLNLTPSTSVFGKLGYHSMKGEVSDNTFARSNSYHGVGYGLGVKTMVNRNVYLQAEATWVDYDSKTFFGTVSKIDFDYEFKTTAGVVTVGYQF